MSRIHLLSLFSVLPLVACGGGEDEIVVEGEHYNYVVSEALVPTSNLQATEFGLDLNGDKSPDNQLGSVLAALKGQGFDVQTAITDAVNQGDIILLLDLQTKSFASSGGTGLQVKLGDAATAMPAPCASMTDIVCRKHLEGTGSFGVATGSPDNAAVAGKIVGGTFNGGPGDISLKIAIGSPEGIQLDLVGARAKATGMSEAGIESIILAGALTQQDLNDKVIPAIHAQIVPLIADDCPGPGNTPPNCNCANPSTGRTIMMLFDTTPKDCVVTKEEIQGNALIMSLLSPDVKIDGKDALSLGIKVKATKAVIR
jgi:hypothetical protein